jgi:hypothetical protein
MTRLDGKFLEQRARLADQEGRDHRHHLIDATADALAFHAAARVARVLEA